MVERMGAQAAPQIQKIPSEQIADIARMDSVSPQITAVQQREEIMLKACTALESEIQRSHDELWREICGDNVWGVVVHGITKASMNLKDQTKTIHQLCQENYQWQETDIKSVRRVSRNRGKRVSSSVIEFATPQTADEGISGGVKWSAKKHHTVIL